MYTKKLFLTVVFSFFYVSVFSQQIGVSAESNTRGFGFSTFFLDNYNMGARVLVEKKYLDSMSVFLRPEISLVSDFRDGYIMVKNQKIGLYGSLSLGTELSIKDTIIVFPEKNIFFEKLKKAPYLEGRVAIQKKINFNTNGTGVIRAGVYGALFLGPSQGGFFVSVGWGNEVSPELKQKIKEGVKKIFKK